MKFRSSSAFTAWWLAGCLTLGCAAQEGLEEGFDESRQPLVRRHA
jgi:hypothetical protein